MHQEPAAARASSSWSSSSSSSWLSSSPSRSVRSRPRPGFTLVELLVVIGIIGLLIAILLPVLAGAKRRADAVACGSNMRQLYLACVMFTQDHKGHLPRPYKVGQLSSSPSFVAVAAFLEKPSAGTGNIDYLDDRGALWKYIKGVEARKKMLMCPGDTGEAMWLGGAVSTGSPRNFSYSFNWLILRDDDVNPKLGLELSRVREGSSRIMIYEELAPNDSWCLLLPSGGGTNWDDYPSGRHGKTMKDAWRNNPNHPEYRSGGRGNFVFFDGHVEMLAPGQLLPHPTDPNASRRAAQYHTPLVKGDRTTF